MSEFKKQLIKLLNHSITTNKSSTPSNFKTYLASSRNKLARNKASIICSRMKENEDISQPSLLSPCPSSAFTSLNNDKNRNSLRKRKDYTEILMNGSMKDIHSPIPLGSFCSSYNLRHDNSSQRINPMKEQIDDFSMTLAHNKTMNKPISIVKKYEVGTFMKASPITMKNHQLSRLERKEKSKENSFNRMQVDTKDRSKEIKSKLLALQKKNPFERANSYSMLLFCSEIDHFRKGFLIDNQ